MPVKNVSVNDKSSEYGVLIYDVPQDCPELYDKIYSKIRGRAIRINYSVYLLLWGMRNDLEKLIDEAQQEAGQYAVVNFVKFDASEEVSIRRMAKESMCIEIKRIAKRLLDAVKRAKEKEESETSGTVHISEGYAWKIENRLKEAKALALLFGLTRDIQHVFEATQKLFAAEMEKILAEREEYAKIKKEKKIHNKHEKSQEEKKASEDEEPEGELSGGNVSSWSDPV